MLNRQAIKLQSEQKIMSSWMRTEKIVVNVVYVSYNYDLHIEDASPKPMLNNINNGSYTMN